MADRPEWAVNYLKYDRALKEVKDSGAKVTEEAVKEVYVRLAGLLLEEAAPEIQETVRTRRSRR